MLRPISGAEKALARAGIEAGFGDAHRGSPSDDDLHSGIGEGALCASANSAGSAGNAGTTGIDVVHVNGELRTLRDSIERLVIRPRSSDGCHRIAVAALELSADAESGSICKLGRAYHPQCEVTSRRKCDKESPCAGEEVGACHYDAKSQPARRPLRHCRAEYASHAGAGQCQADRRAIETDRSSVKHVDGTGDAVADEPDVQSQRITASG